MNDLDSHYALGEQMLLKTGHSNLCTTRACTALEAGGALNISLCIQEPSCGTCVLYYCTRGIIFRT